MRLLPLLTAFFLMPFVVNPVLADDDDDLTRVQFEAQASKPVDNDSMRATLFVEIEDDSPSGASSRATETMNETLRQLQKESYLRVRTGNFRTFPVNNKGSITGWRARSEIVIESRSFSDASVAIASVSSNMQLSRIEFFVSPALRDTVETELADEAIARFLKRADRIAKSFGARAFEVAEASVINQGSSAPVRPMMRSMAADAPAPAPELSGGTTNMSVSVSGVILIDR
ncbi:MAG TPA: SIMPL domain-containing protein [Burkholderiales bacterium]|nr:SIMPL domain-containing protein [Burkholderiales bacterium]